MRKLIIARRCSQVFFLALFIHILWSTTYPLTGLLPPETFFRADPLIMIFTSISERIVLPGLVFSLIMLSVTLVLGRFFCGWICPLGTVIDWTGALRKKSTVPGERTSAMIRKIKFFILGLVALFALFGIQTAWILDPMGMAARFVSLNFIPFVTLAADSLFITVFKGLQIYSGPLYDFYITLKSSVLGVDIHYFVNSGIIFMFFLIVCAAALFVSRSWCRAVCPLGALYSVVARFSLLRRVVDKCSGCRACVRECRMGAITEDAGYVKGECILCMDCVYVCPENAIRFTWPHLSDGVGSDSADISERGISRKDFLFLALTSFFLSGFRRRNRRAGAANPRRNVIRPPGALKENEFSDRCIRCGNCMKVCITNGLQPVVLQAGLEGIWTPQLVPEIGYCEYNCTLCGNVCPTGALTRLSLEEKKKTKLGTARINRSTCLPWSEGRECLLCEEHCPVPEKAIKVIREEAGGKVVLKPYVDGDLCIGCGICQNKCPVRPLRAITVYAEQ